MNIGYQSQNILTSTKLSQNWILSKQIFHAEVHSESTYCINSGLRQTLYKQIHNKNKMWWLFMMLSLSDGFLTTEEVKRHNQPPHSLVHLLNISCCGDGNRLWTIWLTAWGHYSIACQYYISWETEDDEANASRHLYFQIFKKSQNGEESFLLILTLWDWPMYADIQLNSWCGTHTSPQLKPTSSKGQNINKLGEFTMVSQPIRLILVDWFVFN
jgi:hypothetical protein